MVMRYQPQGLLRIARTPLAAGLRLAVLPGVNRSYDATGGRHSTVVGTKQVASGSGMASGFGATLGVGTTDRVSTGITGAFPASGRSYYFRAKRTGAGGGGLGRLFDKTNSQTSGQFFCWEESNTRLRYGYYTAASERIVGVPGTATTAAIGEVFELLFTHFFDGTNNTFNAWVNGERVLADSIVANVVSDNATADFVIGNRATGSRNWDGLIECAYVWDRILDARDAAELYANRYSLYDEPGEHENLFAAASALPNTYTLTAEPGTFGLSGSAASLRVSRKLAGGNGSFSLTGNPATLRAGRRVVGATGVITLAGSTVTLRAVRRLAAAAGAFALTGGAAQLVYSPVAEGATIVTSSGQFVLTGAAVAMRVTRRLQAQAGSFALAGAPVSIFVAGGKVDVSTISPARIVVFEGSGSRIVPFESSGSRVVPFEGSGSRVVVFEGSGSRTVRFQ